MNEYEGDERFEAALARCSDRVAVGQPIEEALTAAPPEFRDALRPLLASAARLGALVREPSPQFANDLEQRLLAAVDTERGKAPRSWWSRLPGGNPARVISAAAIAILLIMASGAFVSQASAESLPGDTLYPVRQAREWIALKLSRGQEQQIEAHAGRLEDRGADLERALARRRSPQVVGVLVQQAARAADTMVDQALATRGNGQSRPVLRALVTLRRGEERLAQVEAIAGPDVRPQLEQLREHLQQDEARLLQGARGSNLPAGGGIRSVGQRQRP